MGQEVEEGQERIGCRIRNSSSLSQETRAGLGCLAFIFFRVYVGQSRTEQEGVERALLRDNVNYIILAQVRRPLHGQKGLHLA
jgi:hypothetical protein